MNRTLVLIALLMVCGAVLTLIAARVLELPELTGGMWLFLSLSYFLGVAFYFRRPRPYHKRPFELSFSNASSKIAIIIAIFGVASLGFVVSDFLWGIGLFLLALALSLYCFALSMYFSHLSASRIAFYTSRCNRCLYDLAGTESSTCPECGNTITPPADAT